MQSTSRIPDISQPASNQDTDSDPPLSQATASEPVFSHEKLSLDVFSELVESPDDFLGMLAYSLYKRHKIEWLQTHPQDDHQAFKKVACTPQQIGMYRSQAEQMAKNFIDVSLEQLGEEMRNTISEGEVMSRLNQMQPALADKIDNLKPGFLKSFGNHLLGGFASALVAILLFGFFTLYSKFQNDGGLEGWLKSDKQLAVSTQESPPPPALNLPAKK